MGRAEIEAFLSSLATEGHVAASTQNQALSAILFLYSDVLQMEMAPLAAGSRETAGADSGGADA